MTDTPHGTARDWHLRSPGPDELSDFMAPIALAFGEEMSQADLDDWAQVIELERTFGAFASASSDESLGFSTALSLRLSVPGGEVGAAGVTAVAVRPDQRRRGILTTMMRRLLEDARSRAEPLAVLWASEGAIYQRFGYGMAAIDGSFEVDVRRTTYLRASAPQGQVRLLGEDESMSAIPPVYDAMRVVTPGAVTRSERWWHFGPLPDPARHRRGAGPKYRAVYEADGAAEGYAIYRIREEWGRSGPKHVLEVSEAVTTTPRALRELWRFLFDTDLVRTVTSSRVPVPSPLQLILADPRALGLVANDGLWLRLVDLPAALAARTYGTADALVLEVSDAFCPWNAGRWRIDTMAAPEGLALVAHSETPADLLLDTTDLAGVYLGGLRPTTLAAAGRIIESTPGALQRADRLFAAQAAPWCVSMF